MFGLSLLVEERRGEGTIGARRWAGGGEVGPGEEVVHVVVGEGWWVAVRVGLNLCLCQLCGWVCSGRLCKRWGLRVVWHGSDSLWGLGSQGVASCGEWVRWGWFLENVENGEGGVPVVVRPLAVGSSAGKSLSRACFRRKQPSLTAQHEFFDTQVLILYGMLQAKGCIQYQHTLAGADHAHYDCARLWGFAQ